MTVPAECGSAPRLALLSGKETETENQRCYWVWGQRPQTTLVTEEKIPEQLSNLAEAGKCFGLASSNTAEWLGVHPYTCFTIVLLHGGVA